MSGLIKIFFVYIERAFPKTTINSYFFIVKFHFLTAKIKKFIVKTVRLPNKGKQAFYLKINTSLFIFFFVRRSFS